MRATLLSLGVVLTFASACATERAARPSDDGRAAIEPSRKKKPRAKRKRQQPRVVEDAPPTTTAGEADLQEGVISWYHDSLAGRRTASGERYNPRARTCAHRKHPFGTRLKVTIADTGASAECRVNDRGPFVDGRVLDVSRALAEELDLIERGVAAGKVVRIVDEDS